MVSPVAHGAMLWGCCVRGRLEPPDWRLDHRSLVSRELSSLHAEHGLLEALRLGVLTGPCVPCWAPVAWWQCVAGAPEGPAMVVGSTSVGVGRVPVPLGAIRCDLGVWTASPSSPRGIFTTCSARCPAGLVLMRIGPFGSASIRGSGLMERLYHGLCDQKPLQPSTLMLSATNNDDDEPLRGGSNSSIAATRTMRTRSQSGVAGSDANTSARSTAVSRAPSVGARRSTRSAVADGAVPSRVAASGAGEAAAGVTTRSASRAASLQGIGPGQRRGGRLVVTGATSEMPGGAGRVDRQVAERTGRSARVGAEGRQAAGLVRNSWGLGAGVLGRRVRVRWPAEEASFDGVMHAWLPGERRHVVRYDDGDEVSHDLCEDQVEWLEGEHEQREQVDAAPVSVPDIVGSVVAEGRAVPPAEVSPSPCRSALQDGLQSPPVPKRLAEFFCTPRVLSGSGVNVGAEADGAEQEQQERVADAAGNPWPSPGMERRLYVGPLFQPVEGEWCGHSMCSMPPTGVVASDGETATFSWVFCPFILDALGWRSSFPNLSRSDEWTRIVDRLAHVFREAGISWEVAADYILEPAVHPFHFSGRRQEELIELEQQVGQEV
eukprot:gene34041-biopygen5800